MTVPLPPLPRLDIPARLASSGIMGIVREVTVDAAIRRALAAVENGVTVLEVSFTLAGASEAISRLRQELGDAALVGAGTVLSRDIATDAIAAGAQFLVSPTLPTGVAEAAGDAGVGYYPGAFSPAEILSAWNSGASAVKVFPAGPLGPDFFRQLASPLPDVTVMAVGGVSLEDSVDYLEAGAAAVGVGSALSGDPSLLRDTVDRLSEFCAARESTR